MLAVKTWAVVFILALLILTLAGTLLVDFASANPDGSLPVLAMPVEYVNYTITRVNGTLWAKIDGNYPIYPLKPSDCAFNGELPMVYPMPPGTTNIHVTLGDRELSWINYTEAYPEASHHTAIGDWWMIYSVLSPVSDFFELKIHYEHPLEVVNGSYLFLYDLNISPYLSPQSNNSTAYFTIRMEANTTNLHAYTTGMSDVAAEWKTISYTTTKESGTGLGLSICYSIAARHKASIQVDTGNTGTTILVRFNMQATVNHLLQNPLSFVQDMALLIS